nr:hypothetical protein [Tanacetum cinerariifolium]
MNVAAMKHMTLNFAKLDKFEGVNFRRWQKKMHFFFSSMSVVYVLTTLIPGDGDDATMDQIRKRVKWDNDNYVCRGLILKAFMSTSKLNDSILWHARLSHVHFKRMQDMSKDGLIPAFDMDTRKILVSRFSMKDMGEADVILVSIPMDTSEKLMPNNGQAVSQLEYSRVIGCLMYTITCTRPDIVFVVGKLSRLTYTGYPLMLEGYTDASWICNTEDNSSISGWVFLLGGAVGKEAEWLKNLLLEIPLWSKPITSIYIRYDSAATLVKAYNQMYNENSRHLGVRRSMIHELITNMVISIEFVRPQQNLADHLMKGLARDLVIKSVEGVGLKSN